MELARPWHLVALAGLVCLAYGVYLMIKEWVRDGMRAFGWWCVVIGSLVAVLTPTAVKTINRQNFDACINTAKKLLSMRMLATCGSDDISVLPGFLVAAAIIGFGVLILAIRPPTQRG